MIDSLKPGGRCGMVLDEGVLFRNNETALVQTKKKLLDDCDLWCIVSLPGGVFTAAGAGVKTNLLFFTRGGPTESIWYYDLSDIKVGKKKPFTIDKFEDFFRLLPDRAGSEKSWTVTRAQIEAKNYDLKGGESEREGGTGSAHAGGTARHRRGETEGDCPPDRGAAPVRTSNDNGRSAHQRLTL